MEKSRDILVSFNLASNRPENFAALCENLEQTADDPTCLEILVKIDDADQAMHACVEREKGQRPFVIKELSSPGTGYFGLWKGLNALHELCDPRAYYVCNINDEIRFQTEKWDLVVRKYVGLFPDHVFRLRISHFRLRNYNDFWECGYAPENYAFFTKRWIDLQGDWNACHGPDSFQQFVAYYLCRARHPDIVQLNRDVPIMDIELSGEGASKGLSGEELKRRVDGGWKAWYVLVSYEKQTECFRRARHLQAFIEAKAAGHEKFSIFDDVVQKRTMVCETEGKHPLTDRKGNTMIYSYRLGWVGITLTNFFRKPMQNYYCGGGRGILVETVYHIPFKLFPRLYPILYPMRRQIRWGADSLISVWGYLYSRFNSFISKKK